MGRHYYNKILSPLLIKSLNKATGWLLQRVRDDDSRRNQLKNMKNGVAILRRVYSSPFPVSALHTYSCL
jgi:hypothetical protein